MSGKPGVWQTACPECRSALQAGEACSKCGFELKLDNHGIMRAFLPARAALLDKFLTEYTGIRKAEGRWSQDPQYYKNLPEVPDGDPMAWQWAIRKKTYQFCVVRLLPRFGEGLRIVDLGAGTGWFSHRLAELGHQPCSVDLSVDDQDGLGAARHFEPAWPRVQAEFDHLPLQPGQADLVIYNASLHYSVDYRVTLSEALRILKPEGRIVILESPLYRREESGRQMLAERHAAFAKKYGTASDTIPSIEFLTWEHLKNLEKELNLRFQADWPWYGWDWAMRPWKAWWSGKREPSRFPILVARRR